MSQVECKSCCANVTPRLWHRDESSLLFYRSIEHICPLCGQTMYVTGGGLTPIAYIVGAAVLWFFLAVFWQKVLGLNNDESATLAWIFWLILVALFVSKKFFGLGIKALLFKVKNKVLKD